MATADRIYSSYTGTRIGKTSEIGDQDRPLYSNVGEALSSLLPCISCIQLKAVEVPEEGRL